ncbi:MAG: VanZ family protein [Clostridia bacterium]|nr:VanZ family protein [Clostridia bacterium]MBQ9996809.1 VanZ family protein [Clostridia bacterium]
MPKKFRIPLWIAVVLWMALIFSFSMETAAESSESSGGFIRTLLETFDRNFLSLPYADQHAKIESLSYFVRKSAHFCIFGMLGLLVTSAVSTHGLSPKKTAAISLGISALYAVSDEVHQYFVPGRACMLRDMLIDTCGAACGVAVISFLICIVRTHRTHTNLSRR